jgi:hypothetical protein
MPTLELIDDETCDLLNGLNLLIEMNDSQPGHYNDPVKWQQLIDLSNEIYKPGYAISQCDFCEGDHQFTTKPSLYGYDSQTMCQSCCDSQEG